MERFRICEFLLQKFNNAMRVKFRIIYAGKSFISIKADNVQTLDYIFCGSDSFFLLYRQTRCSPDPPELFFAALRTLGRGKETPGETFHPIKERRNFSFVFFSIFHVFALYLSTKLINEKFFDPFVNIMRIKIVLFRAISRIQSDLPTN